MARKLNQQIWCEDCACENAEAIDHWVAEGSASARGGLLAVPVACDACDTPLPVGSYALAITFSRDKAPGGPWEGEYLDLAAGHFTRR